MSRDSLSRLDLCVLGVLQPVQYQTIDTVRKSLGIERFAARAQLARLRERELAEDNGEHPLAFRRTVLGDEALRRSR